MLSPSAQLQLPPSPLLQASISPENADTNFSPLTRQKCSKTIVGSSFINLEETQLKMNGDLGRDVVEDEVAEDGVDRATVNYDIPSPPVDQHYNNLEVPLQKIQELTKEHGYSLTILRSKRKGGEVYKVYLQCNRDKFRSALIVTEKNRCKMKGTRCLDCPFSATS